MKVYHRIAQLLTAIDNCVKSGNNEWKIKHELEILRMVKENLPHGSGFDNGTGIVFEKSTPEKLVLRTAFHHMDENGSYDGWTDHDIVVTPSLAFGFTLKVTGIDRNEIKEYIEQCFYNDLNADTE